jgi:hypothetical protein
MSDISSKPSEPNEFRTREYEDPHYHDEDEVTPVADDNVSSQRKPHTKTGKATPLRPIFRHRFEE